MWPQARGCRLHSLVDPQGSELVLAESPHGSGGGSILGGPPPHGSTGGEEGVVAPHGSAGPQGSGAEAGATEGGGEGPAEPIVVGAAGAPHGSTALNSIRELWHRDSS